MPLHLICQCCKCKNSLSNDLWSITRNHKYSCRRYVCPHFDVDIDHASSIGFFGIGWANSIKIKAYYKPNSISQVIIDKTFSENNKEYQNYAKFSNKVVFHARISDYISNYPSCGFNMQNDIEYNERMEQERRERERERKERDRERREEERRKSTKRN